MEISVPSQDLKDLVKIDSDFESCITITVTTMQGMGCLSRGYRITQPKLYAGPQEHWPTLLGLLTETKSRHCNKTTLPNSAETKPK